MKIIEAKFENWEDVQDLNHKSFLYHWKFDKTIDVNWPFSEEGINYYKESTQKNNCKTFLAFSDDDEVIGYICCSMENEYSYRLYKGKKLEITAMFVLDEYRRSGVGRKLVEKAEVYAKENGLSRMFVLCSHDNPKSLEFYRSVGLVDYTVELEKEI